MRVTVCQMHDTPKMFVRDWGRLVTHAHEEESDLVLLPEMPFYRWFVDSRPAKKNVWQAAVTAHETWLSRLAELAPALVVSTRPVTRENRRLNEGFVWSLENGYQAAHLKYYLPDEEGAWEASWYQRGPGNFTPMQSGPARLGFAICSELWFTEHARAYSQAGVHLIVTPRATGRASLEKWLIGGRAAAIVSGTYCLSSNRVTPDGTFGGQGWVVDPDGQVIAQTSIKQPFVTAAIEIAKAEQAKQSYPRYIFE